MTKRKYIIPFVEFSLLEEDELLAGSVGSNANNQNPDEDCAKSSQGFIFDEPKEITFEYSLPTE